MDKCFPPVALLCLIIAAPQAAAGCLRYGDRVTLEGKMIRQTFPGAPDFTSIKDGDEAESGWYVILKRPICMMPGASPQTEAGQEAVRRVQLVLTAGQYQTERGRLDRRVTVSGEPFSAHTGHHHAPMLLTGVEFQ